MVESFKLDGDKRGWIRFMVESFKLDGDKRGGIKLMVESFNPVRANRKG